mmetsp:Transcript_111749/g.222144  ORF Transcript_111749/g.222144 Transcript_111749/m.222144 type:complete len:226 (-) Transcript_111749:69-746(-)
MVEQVINKMTMNTRSAALIESVAQALQWAISNPNGCAFINNSLNRKHNSGNFSRRRSLEEMRQIATVFDSSTVPQISIYNYLLRLSKAFRCSEASFVAALIIVDRLLEYDGGRLQLTMRNVHRAFLASLAVSVKYNEDLVYSNKHYAKAGGVHLKEVNRLEWALLSALDFDLRVEPEQYRIYETCLLGLGSSGGEPQKALVHPDMTVNPTPALVVSERCREHESS